MLSKVKMFPARVPPVFNIIHTHTFEPYNIFISFTNSGRMSFFQCGSSLRTNLSFPPQIDICDKSVHSPILLWRLLRLQRLIINPFSRVHSLKTRHPLDCVSDNDMQKHVLNVNHCKFYQFTRVSWITHCVRASYLATNKLAVICYLRNDAMTR